MHLQQCFDDLGYQAGELPVSEGMARSALSLPIYPELSADDQAYVVDTIAAFYSAK